MTQQYTLDKEQREYFINGFVQAMLFVSNDDKDEQLNNKYTGEDIEPESFKMIERDCLYFIQTAGNKLDSLDLEQCGMDFLYSRNGHGVGFMDREIPRDEALDLDSIAHSFKELHVWVENGKVFCE